MSKPLPSPPQLPSLHYVTKLEDSKGTKSLTPDLLVPLSMKPRYDLAPGNVPRWTPTTVKAVETSIPLVAPRPEDLCRPNPITFPSGPVLVPPPDSVHSTTIVDIQYLAECHNPTLKILRCKIQALRGEWVQVGLKPNPTVGYVADEIGDARRAGKHGVGIEQEIVTGGKLQRNRNVVCWEIDQERRRLELQCQAIQNDVRARAYELLAAQRLVAINQRLADVGNQSVYIAGQLKKAGETSKIDLLQIRAKANEATVALNVAQVNERLAWKRVMAMVGQPDMPQQLIRDSLEEVRPNQDKESAWQVIQGCSPKLAAARSNVQRARAVLAKECAAQSPNVTVSGQIAYDFSEKQTLAGLGVGVPLRIFDRNQGNIQKAHAEIAVAQKELERQTLLLYEEFVQIHSTLESAQQQVLVYRDQVLPDVREAVDMSMKGYQKGEYGYMDVLSAQQLYLEAETQYIQALKDYAIASVYLDGYLAKGGLEEN